MGDRDTCPECGQGLPSCPRGRGLSGDTVNFYPPGCEQPGVCCRQTVGWKSRAARRFFCCWEGEASQADGREVAREITRFSARRGGVAGRAGSEGRNHRGPWISDPRADFWPRFCRVSVYSARVAGGNRCQHEDCSVLAGERDRHPAVRQSQRGRAGMNASLGMSGTARDSPRNCGHQPSSQSVAAGGGSETCLASGFPSKCLKRQRLEIKKELLCGGILRRLCKFLHLEAVCLPCSLDSPKQLVASRGGELSHACNALAPKACLGNFPLLGRGE